MRSDRDYNDEPSFSCVMGAGQVNVVGGGGIGGNKKCSFAD